MLHMKLVVFAENSSYGGISSYCFDLCRELAHRGCDVTLTIPLDKRTTNLWLKDKACGVKIPIEKLELGNGFFDDVRAVDVFLTEHESDVIHTNGYRMNTLVRICRLLHPYKYRNLKHLVTVHSVLPWNISTSRQKLYSLIDCIGHAINSHTIAVSNYTLNYVCSHSLVSKNQITTVYHGMNLQKKEEIKKNDICIVSFLGRLSHEKGISFLVQVIERYLSIHADVNVLFEICGDGEEVDIVLQLEKKFSNQVKYKGFVKDIDNQLEKSDILMLTSKVETFGLVVLEAMVRDVCVIATKVGGIPEIITSGHDGILVGYGDIDSYVSCLHSLIANRVQRMELCCNAWETLRTKFSYQKSIDSYLKILWSL